MPSTPVPVLCFLLSLLKEWFSRRMTLGGFVLIYLNSSVKLVGKVRAESPAIMLAPIKPLSPLPLAHTLVLIS